MPENTTTVWTCSRCGSVEEVAGMGQPMNWIRVGFVHPPKGSWADNVTVVGDLCNGSKCGGLVVAFINGKEEQELATIARIEEATARWNVAGEASS